MDAWSIFVFIVFFASVPLATEMAPRAWKIAQALVLDSVLRGPLAPLSAPVLGDRRDSEAKSRLTKLGHSENQARSLEVGGDFRFWPIVLAKVESCRAQDFSRKY